MYAKEKEVITNSKDINVIKEQVFNVYPELRKYGGCCSLEREFGENEECGINKIIFMNSFRKNIEVIIIYSKKLVDFY